MDWVIDSWRVVVHLHSANGGIKVSWICGQRRGDVTNRWRLKLLQVCSQLWRKELREDVALTLALGLPCFHGLSSRYGGLRGACGFEKHGSESEKRQISTRYHLPERDVPRRLDAVRPFTERIRKQRTSYNYQGSLEVLVSWWNSFMP